MTELALGLAALLAVACVAAVALPFLRDPGGGDQLDEPDARDRRLLELAEERDRALADLKELEFDHRTGKVSDEDYRDLVASLRARAAAALRALDSHAGRDMIEPMRAEQPEPARIPEPFPPPDEGDPPEPAIIPEPFPPPDEGDRPKQPEIPEPGPQGPG